MYSIENMLTLCKLIETVCFQKKGRGECGQMGETDILKKWINESNYIVFFGGAGVSTESNIPDFRSTDGCTIRSMTIRRKRF